MVIADSSTLILLSKVELLDLLLKNLKEKVVIPPTVQQECTIKERSWDAIIIQRRINEHEIIVRNLKHPFLYHKLLHDFNLGAGEAEAIALCLERKEVLMTDDKKAIKACKLFNIEFVTAPNIVVALTKKKVVDLELALEITSKLQKYGRYSPEIIQKMKEDLL